MSKLNGIWLPIITPFKNGKIDFESYKRLIEFYSTKGISGIIPNGTTGESPTIEEDEFEELIDKTIEFNTKDLPVYFGLGGNHTNNIIKKLKIVEKYSVDGILSVSPYYSKPDQKGISEHFKAIASSTDKNIIVYNVPHRTGRNIENPTIFELSEIKNIVGVKDSGGDIMQSMDLIFNRPEGFSVLTGEDHMFYLTASLGGDGGILAASHLQTEQYVSVFKDIQNNDLKSALKTWKEIEKNIPLLFKESNPMPLKYILNKLELIDTPELRLPLTGISDDLKKELNQIF
ncbi:4-hydroxy-tetrahydrodipicolinate synthase [Flavobacterium amniphilum]|uniref:4-hydroxy-tetrahydrodipicolinate synthase n=1 Tax=Flavobacterium amniphilum TaxID=1834035 RepID=UPI00202A65B1|nr:4-hydroxy-tetrahydrodipicolinate synthase [Flavobacterium amniphilum]MCL9806546.1 4-hydroxy-tetrahydrodipicolinate synthase [Flavobacterium amniphilum]